MRSTTAKNSAHLFIKAGSRLNECCLFIKRFSRPPKACRAKELYIHSHTKKYELTTVGYMSNTFSHSHTPTHPHRRWRKPGSPEINPAGITSREKYAGPRSEPTALDSHCLGVGRYSLRAASQAELTKIQSDK